MDFIKQNDRILLLWDSSYDLAASGFNADSIKNKFNAIINFENIERLSLGKNKTKSTYFHPCVYSSELNYIDSNSINFLCSIV